MPSGPWPLLLNTFIFVLKSLPPFLFGGFFAQLPEMAVTCGKIDKKSQMNIFYAAQFGTFDVLFG